MLLIHRVLLNNVATIDRRLSSKASGLIDVAVDSEGIATARMQRAPVNSLNSEMLQALHDTIDELHKTKCKGMILTSAFPRVYCAGIDLIELVKPDLKRLETFTNSLFNLMEKLFEAEIITSAAINGYTVAEGCLLSILSDYRVMCKGGSTIGFNDTALGITPGKWVLDLFTYNMDRRRAELLLTSSAMLQAEEALKAGLTDEIAADNDDAIMKCRNFIKLFDNIPRDARLSTKRLIRRPYLTVLAQNRLQYEQDFMQSIRNPDTQAHLDYYMKMLKIKKPQ